MIGASLDGVGDLKYLSEAGEGEREQALASADAVLAWMLRPELRPDELTPWARPA